MLTFSLSLSLSSRDSQAAGQQLQIELDTVRSELATLKLESSTLRQALEDTQTQLQHYTNHRKSTVAYKNTRTDTQTDSHLHTHTRMHKPG